MTKRKITNVKVYWDTQDPNNMGWSYNASDEDGLISSGGVDAAPCSIDSAIEDVIFDLDLPLTSDDFWGEGSIDGGFAVWSAE